MRAFSPVAGLVFVLVSHALGAADECVSSRCSDAAAVAAVRARVADRCPCDAAPSHSAYIRCAKNVIGAAVADGSLPRACRQAGARCERRSTCGFSDGAVACCEVGSTPGVRARIVPSSKRCAGASCRQSSHAVDACATDGTCRVASPPNVVWIVADDMSGEIGAFGDALARTPNLDALAAEGTRYTRLYATAPTCAPARASLLTGMYATSIGAHHMRSLDRGYQPVPPAEVKAFTEYLRAAGYYTSNLGKLDYQFSGLFDAPITDWDEPNGDWRGRAAGQPFFALVNVFDTHEIQLFGDNSVTVTDPNAVSVPPYYPDTPLVRRDFAEMYDNVADLDVRVGQILDMLEKDGVADETIVFFFGDNGRGFPRDKRWVYDGGIHEPLIVRWPGTLSPGSVSAELLSFVDMAPTILALAGATVPGHMQGRVFLGDATQPEPEFVFAASDRNDEAEDRIRAVRDRRYKYVRNYRPEVPYGQTIAFRDNLTTMQEIVRLEGLGLLAPPADWYFRQTKPVEELYDTESDPFEIDDLAGRPEHAATLARMRAAHDDWALRTGDLGAIPETDLAELYWPQGIQPKTAPPVITTAPGPYPRTVEVTLASPTAGASLAYTTSRTSPAEWRLYTKPVVVEDRAHVRARAIRYGWAESAEVTADLPAAP